MVSVAVAVGALEARYQYIRTEGSDHAHDICEAGLVTMPLLKRLVGILGKPEVRDARETLLHPVEAIRGRQLERAQNTEHVEQIAANLVLTPFAAIQGQQQHGVPFSAGLARHHAAVFVVRVCGCVHEPRSCAEPPEHQLQPSVSGFLRQGAEWASSFLCGLRGASREQEQTE